MSGLEIFLVLFFGSILAPLVKRYLTAPIRRWVKRALPEGHIKRALLTPLGYTKRARDGAAFEATMEDYRLLRDREKRGNRGKGLTSSPDL